MRSTSGAPGLLYVSCVLCERLHRPDSIHTSNPICESCAGTAPRPTRPKRQRRPKPPTQG